jgi:hypothetical protein
MFLGFGPRNISSDMFLGWPRNISSFIPRCHMAEGHNLCSSAPMSMQSYVHQDIFFSYVSQLAEEHLSISYSDLFASLQFLKNFNSFGISSARS